MNRYLSFRQSLLLVFFISVSSLLNAQNRLAQWLATQEAQGIVLQKKQTPLFVYDAAMARKTLPLELKAGTRLRLDAVTLRKMYADASAGLLLDLPTADGKTVTLQLVAMPITNENFVAASDQNARTAYKGGVHYRGIMAGKPKSLAAISLFEDEVMGLFADETGNHVLGKLEDGSDDYILYNDNNLTKRNNFRCADLDYEEDAPAAAHDANRMLPPATLCKKVTMYWEGDYFLYQKKGNSLVATNNYLTGVFNQIAVLYANEGIAVELVKTFVYTTPDGYPTSSSGAALTAFRTYWNGLGDTFGSYTRCNGAGNQTTEYADLAHFISQYNTSGFAPNGGVAYLFNRADGLGQTVLCSRASSYGYSNVDAVFNSVPTFSWDVEVITHEIGHNLGSKHTHNCNWPGGMIDGCGPASGNCDGGCPDVCANGPIPASSNSGGPGATIMSYCHLLGSASNINFVNGFGPLPQAHIRTDINNATCLKPIITTCSTPTNICNTNDGVVTTAISSASTTTTSYTYNWNNGASLQNISGLGAAGTYTITVTDNNMCTSSATALVRALPKTAMATGGGDLCCNLATTLASNAASNVDACNTVAWLRTTVPLTTDLQAKTAYNSATVANIFTATTVNAGSGASTLDINNNSCLTTTTYFTPFVSQKAFAGLPLFTLSRNMTGASTAYTGGCSGGNSRGDFANFNGAVAPVSPDACHPRVYSGWTVTLTVTGYTGIGGSTVNIRDNVNGKTLIKNISGNGVYVYTQNDFPSGYNPLNVGYIIIFQSCSAGIRANFTATIDITYPAIPAVTTTFEDQCISNQSVVVDYKGTCSSLPVRLLDFNAYWQNKSGILDWTTATELNNNGFEIETRSNINDNDAWETLGFVKGNGTTSSQHKYSFIDKKPYAPVAYYRLKQVDFDGKVEYSNIVQLTKPLETANKLSISPNPLPRNQDIQVYFNQNSTTEVLFSVYDAMGRLVMVHKEAANANAQNYTLAVSNEKLAAGLYYIQIQWNGNKNAQTLKFIQE